MSPRLILAYALSLALHGSLFLPGLLQRQPAPPPPPALQARLRLPLVPELPPEPLLKNTLDEEAQPTLEAPPPPPKPQPTAKTPSRREVQTAQRKLSEHLFYPPEAVARGLEGEVRLILTLSASGSVEDVAVAASSGHPVLDNAAIRAAYAMGKLSGSPSRELILPVLFRLQ